MRGQLVVVTGGARGIGLATAEALSKLGARVVIGDVDGDVVAAEAARLNASVASGAPVHGSAETPGEVLGLALDVRDEAQWVDFLATARSHFDDAPIDALVNNAGVSVAGSFVDTTPAEHQVQWEVNYLGVMTGMRLVLPGMIERGQGRIVNVASAASRIPAAGTAVYTASKHAVLGLSEAVRAEVMPHGIWVSVVLPAVVRTTMMEGLDLDKVPSVTAEEAGAGVVRVLLLERPGSVTFIPRWLSAAALADRITPQRVRDKVRQKTRVGVKDTDARGAYESRMREQLDF